MPPQVVPVSNWELNLLFPALLIPAADKEKQSLKEKKKKKKRTGKEVGQHAGVFVKVLSSQSGP